MKKNYLNINDITNSLRISEDNLRKWIKEGKFPRPFRINDRTTLWSYALIENWLVQQRKTEELFNNQDLDL
ncbi:AlpA family phage regulatory protein [Methylophilales bacterium]|nr:AlpA family phage regulatory protein [Methylophilales bacterium]